MTPRPELPMTEGMEYDQITRDLARLAADRVNSAIHSVLQLCDCPDQAVQVAIMAAGTAIGNATGALSAKYGPEIGQAEATAMLFDLLNGAPHDR